MIHNAFILWTAPGLFSRTHNKCPCTRNSRSGLVGQRLFVKHRWRSIPQNKRPGDIIAFQIYSGHKLTPLNCQFSIPTPQYITQNTPNQILLRAQKFLHFSQIVIIFCDRLLIWRKTCPKNGCALPHVKCMPMRTSKKTHTRLSTA